MWLKFGEEGLRLSHLFGTAYRQVALEEHVDFLDAAAYIGPSDADGVHLTAEAHHLLGCRILEKVREMLSGNIALLEAEKGERDSRGEKVYE